MNEDKSKTLIRHIGGWVARTRNGKLCYFPEEGGKPYRTNLLGEELEADTWGPFIERKEIPECIAFDKLKWEDEPIRVKIEELWELERIS